MRKAEWISARACAWNVALPKAESLATCTPQGTQFVACEVPAARSLLVQP
jgi:hypothetical protein